MKKNRFKLSLLASTAVLLILSACNNSGTAPNQPASNNNDDTTDALSKAICVVTPTEGHDVKGVVTFTQTDAGVLIVADIEGLTEGKHGFHIHEWGDISKPDGTSAGGHFNPGGADHAGPEDSARHAGDLGNIVADENGNAHYEELNDLVSFSGQNSILGRSIIIHVGEDDLESQPTGDAGGRVAAGVIGVAK